MKFLKFMMTLIILLLTTSCISIKYREIDKYLNDLSISYNEMIISIENIKCEEVPIIYHDHIEQKQNISFELNIENNSNESKTIYIKNYKFYNEYYNYDFQNEIFNFHLKTIDKYSTYKKMFSINTDEKLEELNFTFYLELDDNKIYFNLFN